MCATGNDNGNGATGHKVDNDGKGTTDVDDDGDSATGDGCDNEDDGNGRQQATKLTMMATAQATKSTTMANKRQATKSTIMASAADDDDNGATRAITYPKSTSLSFVVPARRQIVVKLLIIRLRFCFCRDSLG